MSEILTHVEAGIGWVTINRPQALNAITIAMFHTLGAALREWESDPSIKFVVIEGAGGKAFSAGGDVRIVTTSIKNGEAHLIENFFKNEYKLNGKILHYSKPYVAIIDGIAMGGGLGVSILGSHRIVTEKARLAMPEAGIGFFPDVGASTFLNYAPGCAGLYLALTGFVMNAADALWAGIATHYIPSDQLIAFKKDLSENNLLDKTVEKYAQAPEEKSFLETHIDQINEHFDKDSLKEIMGSLKNDPSPFAQNTYNTLLSKAPMSLAVIFHLFRNVAPPLSFDEKLQVDFRLTLAFFKGHDFVEGVRAVLVDKDKLPKWKPSSLDEIKQNDVISYFKPLGDRELEL